jgi:predicted transcriptional regulator
MTSVDHESDLFDTPGHSDTTDTVSLTVDLPRALVERLNALAGRTTWDVSDFVREALAGYIPHEERELTLTEAAIAEVEAGVPGIPHEKVKAWMESWGTPDELPFPG